MSIATRKLIPLFIAPVLGLVLGARAAPDESRAAAATADTGVTLTSSQFELLKGRYHLQDGSLLLISGSYLRPKASMDGVGPMPMHALSPQELVSADGRVVLRFSSVEDGDNATVRLSRAAADPLFAKAGR